MAAMCFVVLIVTLASPWALGQLVVPTTTAWPPLSSNGTCDNSLSGVLLTMFSSDSAFSTVVISSISYVNSSVICKTNCQAAAQSAVIKVYLFYGPKNTDYQEETLENMQNLLTGGHWNYSRNATCFFPGWTKNATSPYYSTTLVDAYLANGTTNLLVVEWPTQQEYSWVVCLMPFLAVRIASAFDGFASATRGNVSTMAFVGHSLGAHLCGYVSRLLSKLLITLIAALDPAGPLFDKAQWRCQEGVRANDAKIVVTVHTDSGRFGSGHTTGLIDYYPNNGTYVQPGCTPYDTNPTQCTAQFLCSHTRALFFWCDAVRFPGTVIGRLCQSETAFASGLCNGNPTNDITDPTSSSGQYYLMTNAASPYGKGINGA